MNEMWKDIEDYEGLYQVSNLGNVKNIKTNKILKPEETPKGYLRIRLSKNHICKNYKIHRLVGKAFIPNPDNLPQINHKDENKHNNTINNLEWCDNWYNNHYGSKALRGLYE